MSFNLKDRRPGAKYSSPDTVPTAVPTDQPGSVTISNTVRASHSTLHPRQQIARSACSHATPQGAAKSRKVLTSAGLTLFQAVCFSHSCLPP